MGKRNYQRARLNRLNTSSLLAYMIGNKWATDCPKAPRAEAQSFPSELALCSLKALLAKNGARSVNRIVFNCREKPPCCAWVCCEYLPFKNREVIGPQFRQATTSGSPKLVPALTARAITTKATIIAFVLPDDQASSWVTPAQVKPHRFGI